MEKPVIQLGSLPLDSEAGLVERTIAALRQFIRDQKLGPGDVLPSESALAEQLGVSRVVMREAFRALSALRIIETGNGRRARVGAPDAAPLSMMMDHTVYTRQLSIQQILDVRRTLEMRTVALAALRRTPEETQVLSDIVAQMFAKLAGAEPCTTELMELDIRFHEVIARASRNPLHAILVSSFRVITRQTWHIGWHSRATPENRLENIRCHEQIALAIRNQDVARAEAAMAEHFDSAMSVLLHAGIN